EQRQRVRGRGAGKRVIQRRGGDLSAHRERQQREHDGERPVRGLRTQNRIVGREQIVRLGAFREITRGWLRVVRARRGRKKGGRVGRGDAIAIGDDGDNRDCLR